MVWEPKSCCGCGSPRTGTLVLGYLGVVSAVFSIIGAIKESAMPKEEMIKYCKNEEEGGEQYLDDETCYELALSGIISTVVESIISGLISVLLIVGVNKRNQCLMLPYMIFQVIQLVVVGIVLFAVVIFLAVFHVWLGCFILLLIGTGIMFLLTYCFLVVRVCYKEVKYQNPNIDNEIEVGYLPQEVSAPPPYKVSAPPPYKV